MASERCGIFISRQFSAISRQEFFPEHSTEKRCNFALNPTDGPALLSSSFMTSPFSDSIWSRHHRI